MIEWRDMYELPDYGQRAEFSDEYRQLSSDEIEHLSDDVEAMYSGYVAGALESRHRYSGDDDSDQQILEFNYDHIGINAYDELVDTRTTYTFEHTNFYRGIIKQVHCISIVRQIASDFNRSLPVDGSTYVAVERFVERSFLERYTITEYSGGHRQAHVDQVDLTTEHGEMRESAMSLYDASQLINELDKLNDLNAAYLCERAKIEQ